MIFHVLCFSATLFNFWHFRHLNVSHPLSIGSEKNYSLFTKNCHKYISASLFTGSPSTRLQQPGLANDDEKEEEEEGATNDEIKDWVILLQMLPCLANHVRLFGHELERRRSYIEDIDRDLMKAGGAAEVSTASFWCGSKIVNDHGVYAGDGQCVVCGQ